MEGNTYKIYGNEETGEVHVTEEVIAIIAGLAATEVEGVASLANNITNELISKLGRKHLAAGVNVSCADGEVSVSLALVLDVGFNIPEVSKKVQEKVKTAIESMTDLKVVNVDIEVSKMLVND